MVVSGPDLHGLALVLVRREDPQGAILHSPEDLLQGSGKAGPRTGSRAKEPAGSYQAFMKMLRTWTASLVLQLMVVFRERMRTDAPRSAHHRRLRGLRRRWQSARTAADEVQRVAFFSPVGSEAAAWQGRETAQVRLASRPGGAFPCQEGQQPPDLADGHVARGDRPALGLANRALRQQRTGPFPADDREFAQAALATADAGFVGYDYWKEVINSGRHFWSGSAATSACSRTWATPGRSRASSTSGRTRPPPSVCPRWCCVWLWFMMEGNPAIWSLRCSMRSNSRTSKWRRSTGFAGGSRCSIGTSSRPSSDASCGASRRTTPKSKPSGRFWDCGRWDCMPSRCSPQRESPPDGLVSRECYGRIAGRCTSTKATPIQANP